MDTGPFKVEVIADSSGKWASNGLEFETQYKAEAYGRDLFMRWTSVRQWRVIDSKGAQVGDIHE